MPRRKKATAFTLQVGKRLYALRVEKGLTLARVGEGGEDDGNLKGHVSNIERGLVAATVVMLKKVAENLEIELPYLVTFPDESKHQALVERTRFMTEAEVEELLQRLGPAPAQGVLPERPRKKRRHRRRNRRASISAIL